MSTGVSVENADLIRRPTRAAFDFSCQKDQETNRTLYPAAARSDNRVVFFFACAGHASSQRARPGLVSTLHLLGQPARDGPDTRDVEQ